MSDYQKWSQTNWLVYDFGAPPANSSGDSFDTYIADGATATFIGEYTGNIVQVPGSLNRLLDASNSNNSSFLPDGETVGNNTRADVIYLVNTTTREYSYLS